MLQREYAVSDVQGTTIIRIRLVSTVDVGASKKQGVECADRVRDRQATIAVTVSAEKCGTGVINDNSPGRDVKGRYIGAL